MKDTSLEAYNHLVKTKKLSPARQIVLSVFEMVGEPLTDKDIAAALDWPINRVTGRRGELVKAGILAEAGKVKRGNTHETLWEITGE